MAKMIAYCGLICTDCIAYLATQKDDDTERQKVVEKWSSDDYPMTIGDINCDGCLAVGKRLIKFCNECEVRACGIERKVENCAHCNDFGCEKLEKLWGMLSHKEPRARLEEIRKNLRT
jgi:hypothetical protein